VAASAPKPLSCAFLPALVTLGIDPGQNTGLAIVGPEGIRWAETWHWPKLEECTTRPGIFALGFSPVRSVSECLGKVAGPAKGRYSSWATMSRYAGRVDEMARTLIGAYPILVTPGEWRASVGLGANPSDEEILGRVKAMPGCPKDLTIHAAEAVLIACYRGAP
jgi:hypothetical protein